MRPKLLVIDETLRDFYSGKPLADYNRQELEDIYRDYAYAFRQYSQEFQYLLRAIDMFLQQPTKLYADCLNRARWSAYPLNSDARKNCGYVPEYGRH